MFFGKILAIFSKGSFITRYNPLTNFNKGVTIKQRGIECQKQKDITIFRNTQKAQDFVGLVLFLLLYFVIRALRGIFEFRRCILTYFSKNRT